MKIIVCALNIEANPLKEYFDNSFKFYICGVKAKKLEFLERLNKNDIVFNIGLCGGKNIGEMYLCNKINSYIDINEIANIESHISNKNKQIKSFYPDVINQDIVKQSELTTLNHLANEKEIQLNSNTIFDQEAAIIYKQASKYIGPHQMHFLKIVSDSGISDNKISKENIKEKIKNKIPQIENYIKLIENHKLQNNENIDNNNDLLTINEISELLKCSVSMQNRLEQQIRYAKIIACNYSKFFEKLKNDNLIPVTHKKDGIKILNDFDEYLISKTN